MKKKLVVLGLICLMMAGGIMAGCALLCRGSGNCYSLASYVYGWCGGSSCSAYNYSYTDCNGGC